MAKKKVFIAFAIEDKKYRDFMVGQAKNENSPFEFVDMSVKKPWDSAWKTNCRRKIRGCDGVIALVSKNTMSADGARWEMKCADEEDVPMIGVHVSKDDKGTVPPELAGYKVINWTWNGMKNFINSL